MRWALALVVVAACQEKGLAVQVRDIVRAEFLDDLGLEPARIDCPHPIGQMGKRTQVYDCTVLAEGVSVPVTLSVDSLSGQATYEQEKYASTAGAERMLAEHYRRSYGFPATATCPRPALRLRVAG